MLHIPGFGGVSKDNQQSNNTKLRPFERPKLKSHKGLKMKHQNIIDVLKNSNSIQESLNFPVQNMQSHASIGAPNLGHLFLLLFLFSSQT